MYILYIIYKTYEPTLLYYYCYNKYVLYWIIKYVLYVLYWIIKYVLYVLYCIAELRVQPTIRLNRKRKNAVVVDSDFLSDINNDDDAW